MRKIAILSFVISSFLFIVSCSSDVDTTKPTIEIVSPTGDQEIALGSVFVFKAHLADNSGLASYKIEVHAANDEHQHKGNNQTFAERFSYEFIGQVPNEAKSFTAEEAIKVPLSVQEGHYHAGITVLDTFGNQNQQFVEVFIGEEHTH
ncbi:MAG TPA: DUF4625 domain-containing protein [Flavobacterium sp.]|nr:DUF4625 domain-containing protein [Flavobacterium sp.]